MTILTHARFTQREVLTWGIFCGLLGFAFGAIATLQTCQPKPAVALQKLSSNGDAVNASQKLITTTALTSNAADRLLLTNEMPGGVYGDISEKPNREESAMLWAISQVESGGDLMAVHQEADGTYRFGEFQMSADIILSYYQAHLPQVASLADYNAVPPLLHLGPNGAIIKFDEADQVSIALWWLRSIQVAHPDAVTVKPIYKLWNPGADDELCQRVENLFEKYLQEHNSTTSNP